MSNYKDFIKNNQQPIALVAGYLMVAVLAFTLGKYGGGQVQTQGKTASPQVNYTGNVSNVQTQANVSNNVQEQLNCEGKIKGSSSMIYHMPNGAFYSKTTRPIRCFDSETEAKAAGFRRSSR